MSLSCTKSMNPTFTVNQPNVEHYFELRFKEMIIKCTSSTKLTQTLYELCGVVAMEASLAFIINFLNGCTKVSRNCIRLKMERAFIMRQKLMQQHVK